MEQSMMKFNTTSIAFSDYLNVWVNNPFFDEEHCAFVKRTADAQMSLQTEDVKLVLPCDQSFNIKSIKSIQDTLKYRYPVYWGKYKSNFTNEDFFTRFFGITPDQISDVQSQQQEDIFYSISGPISVMKYKNIPEFTANAITIEGINFESINTAHFKKFIVDNDWEWSAICDDYYNRHMSILQLIIDTAFAHNHDLRRRHIQFPLFGGGVFLKVFVENEEVRAKLPGMKEELLKIQVKALDNVLQKNKLRNFKMKLCIFNPDEFEPSLVASYTDLLSEYSNFKIGIGSSDGNLLNVDHTLNNFIVNAGDQKSWIGNGMNKDFTVEGFLGANAGGYNKQFRNTMILHNVFFQPHLMDPTKWIIPYQIREVFNF